MKVHMKSQNIFYFFYIQKKKVSKYRTSLLINPTTSGKATALFTKKKKTLLALNQLC